MGLFEMILSNPLFLIVIVWILFTMFRKGKTKEEEEKKSEQASQSQSRTSEENTHRSENPVDQAKEVFESIFSQTNKPWETVEEPEISAADQRQNQYKGWQEVEIERKRSDALEAKRTAQKKLDNTIRSNDIKRSEISDVNAKKLLDFNRMNQRTIVKGYIWSEIFGPPKAKRTPGPQSINRWRQMHH